MSSISDPKNNKDTNIFYEKHEKTDDETNKKIAALNKNLFCSLMPFLRMPAIQIMSCIFQDRKNEIESSLNDEVHLRINQFKENLISELEKINEGNVVSEQIHQLKGISIEGNCQLGVIRNQSILIRDNIFMILMDIKDPTIRAKMKDCIQAMEQVPRFFEEFGPAMETYEQFLTGVARTDKDRYEIVCQFINMESSLKGKAGERAEWIRPALEIAIRSDGRFKQAALRKIVQYWIHYGEFKKALDVAKQMSPHCMDHTIAWRDICQAYTMDNRLDEAIDRAQCTKDSHAEMECLAHIVKVLAQRDMKQAIEVVAQKNWSEFARNNALKVLSEFSMRGGNISQATELASQISSKTRRAMTVYAMVRVWLEQGNIPKALEVVHDIQHEARQEEALLEIIHALLEQGNIPKALEVAHDIQHGARQASALLEIIHALLQKKSNQKIQREAIDQALKIASQIQVLDVKNEAFLAISKALIREDIYKALEVAHRMEDVDLRTKASRQIVQVLISQNEIEKALKIAMSSTERPLKSGLDQAVIALAEVDMPQALQIARKFPEPDQKNVLDELSISAASRGEVPQALEIAHLISDEERQQATLFSLSERLFKYKDIDQAIVVLSEVHNPNFDDEKEALLHDIAIFLAKDGKFERAKEVAQSMSKNEDRQAALQEIQWYEK